MQEGIKHLASLLKELGIPGFLVLIVVAIFLTFGTPDQKQEFIDKYILLKEVEDNPFPFSLVVILLLLIIISMYYFNSRKLKMREEENKRLGQQKSDTQKRLLNKDLPSSGKK